MADHPATDIGARLRRAREARGVTLRQVADATKISVRALEAIERNDLSQLPGGIFGRAFVRAYATEVGLDPEVVLRDCLAATPSDTLAVPTSEPSSIDGLPRLDASDRRLWMLALLVAAALGLIGLTGYWIWTTRTGREPAATAAERRARARLTVDARGVQPAPRVPAVQPALDAAEHARAAASPSEAPARGIVVRLEARSACWISLTIDGGRSTSRLLPPGEIAVLEAEREIVLKVGDAAALALTVNGRQTRSLGGAGEVVTTRISRETLESLVTRP